MNLVVKPACFVLLPRLRDFFGSGLNPHPSLADDDDDDNDDDDGDDCDNNKDVNDDDDVDG